MNKSVLNQVTEYGNDDSTSLPSTSFTWITDTEGYPPRIETVTNRFGGVVTFDYKIESTQENEAFEFNVPVVESITVNDDNGNEVTTIFDHQGGIFNQVTRELRGFATVVQYNPDNTTVETSYHTDEFRKGRFKVREFLGSDLDQTLLKKITNGWSEITAGSNWGFVKLTSTRTEWDGDTEVNSLVEYYYNDTHGQVTQKVSYGTDGATVTED